MPERKFERIVISAGINDPPGACLDDLRQSIRSPNVIWVLPAPINSARSHVAAVAARYGDKTVSYACAGGCSRVNFHPASYAVLAEAVRRAWTTR